MTLAESIEAHAKGLAGQREWVAAFHAYQRAAFEFGRAENNRRKANNLRAAAGCLDRLADAADADAERTEKSEGGKH